MVSAVDSTLIIDTPEARDLDGKGCMLYSSGMKKVRAQCAFTNKKEIERTVAFIAEQYDDIAPLES